MGIPRLFFWLYKNYPDVLVELKREVLFPVDTLSYDLNARIHPICQKLVGYGQTTSNKPQRLLHQSSCEASKKTPSDSEIFEAVCQDIEALRKMVNPKKQLVIAIDGSAGMSKMNQQRQRRFKTTKERDEKEISLFDSNKITSGSVFMNELSVYIHKFIINQLKTNPAWKDLEIVFSNEKHPGEGEHKIVRYFSKKAKENPDKFVGKTIFIHSPDADLIMLALGLSLEIPKTNLFIIRENIYDDNPCSHFLIDVSKLKHTLISLMVPHSQSVNHDLVISDFILMGFLLGNDFLPHSPSIEILLEGIETLFSCYLPTIEKHGHLTYTKLIDNRKEWCINTKAFQEYLYQLSTYESQLIVRRAYRNDLVPEKLLLAHFKERPPSASHNCSQDRYQFMFPPYRQAYYTQKMKTNPQNACKKYFEGMMFVLKYYLDELPDWNWQYEFHYAPFLAELYQCVIHFDGEMRFVKHSPLSPIEQLWSVIPDQSKGLLPKEVQDKISDKRLEQFYPKTFVIDLEGTKNAYEGVICLPFVNTDNIRAVFKEVILRDYDVERNRFSKIKVFRRKVH